MLKPNALITRYIWQAVLPYFAFAWILLTAILFLQQAGRYADIFLGNKAPAAVVWQLAFALLPNVIAFTSPMALLVGIVIGLARLQGDSELTAMRAAGVSNWQLLTPVVLLGFGISSVCFLINLQGIPFAAQVVRQVGLQTALYKLESPIDPGVFSTEIPGYVIYVREGAKEDGTWRRVFVHQQGGAQERMIYAATGKIDSSEEKSEIVLQDASLVTIPAPGKAGNLSRENFGDLRLTIPTKRKELIDRLAKAQELPEELGLAELAAYAREKTGKERTEAEILWQRRISLSLAPLILAWLGGALSLRLSRGGRGWGVFVAFAVLVGYYLFTLFGEQIARSEVVSVFVGGMIPPAFAFGLGLAALQMKKLKLGSFSGLAAARTAGKKTIIEKKSRSFSWQSGLLDFDIITNLLKYFVFTVAFLISIYLIFTSFELWKFVLALPNGSQMLVEYLFYLVPFVLLQIIPSALMVAILATYVLKARKNELVTWIASGQSVYRLLAPCFALMIVFGLVIWQFQETVVPYANRNQDKLRSQIRAGVKTANKEGTFWIAAPNRIYSYSVSDPLADNTGAIEKIRVFEFDNKREYLKTLYQADEGSWRRDQIFLGRNSKRYSLSQEVITEEALPPDSLAFSESEEPFGQAINKPTHLNTPETVLAIRTTESELEKRSLEVSLQRRYSAPLLPLVIAFFTAPFALRFGRGGRLATVAYAIGVWLLFTGTNTLFEQYGLSGTLSQFNAVWSPLLLFTLIGSYLLTRIRT